MRRVRSAVCTAHTHAHGSHGLLKGRGDVWTGTGARTRASGTRSCTSSLPSFTSPDLRFSVPSITPTLQTPPLAYHSGIPHRSTRSSPRTFTLSTQRPARPRRPRRRFQRTSPLCPILARTWTACSLSPARMSDRGGPGESLRHCSGARARVWPIGRSSGSPDHALRSMQRIHNPPRCTRPTPLAHCPKNDRATARANTACGI